MAAIALCDVEPDSKVSISNFFSLSNSTVSDRLQPSSGWSTLLSPSYGSQCPI